MSLTRAIFRAAGITIEDAYNLGLGKANSIYLKLFAITFIIFVGPVLLAMCINVWARPDINFALGLFLAPLTLVITFQPRLVGAAIIGTILGLRYAGKKDGATDEAASEHVLVSYGRLIRDMLLWEMVFIGALAIFSIEGKVGAFTAAVFCLFVIVMGMHAKWVDWGEEFIGKKIAIWISVVYLAFSLLYIATPMELLQEMGINVASSGQSAASKKRFQYAKKSAKNDDSQQLICLEKNFDARVAKGEVVLYEEMQTTCPSAFKSSSTKKDGAAQLGKSANCGYFTVCYWTNVAHKWSEEWGVPLFFAGFLVILAVLVHFIPFIWGGKWLLAKKDGTVTVGGKTTSAKNVLVVSSTNWGNVLFVVLAVSGLFYLYATKSGSGKEITTRIFGSADTNMVVPDAVMTKEEAPYWRAYIVSPTDHPFYDKPLGIRVGIPSNHIAKPNDEKPMVITADANNVYILRNTVCGAPLEHADGAVYKSCGGHWDNGRVTGDYDITLSAKVRKVTLTSDGLPQNIKMEFRKVFRL